MRHIAKISNLKNNNNKLSTWFITMWPIGGMAIIHVANYPRKTFRYVVDYSGCEIATWIYHVAKLPHGNSLEYCSHVAKLQVFCSVYSSELLELVCIMLIPKQGQKCL
jgi:hypothetical protein